MAYAWASPPAGRQANRSVLGSGSGAGAAEPTDGASTDAADAAGDCSTVPDAVGALDVDESVSTAGGEASVTRCGSVRSQPDCQNISPAARSAVPVRAIRSIWMRHSTTLVAAATTPQSQPPRYAPGAWSPRLSRGAMLGAASTFTRSSGKGHGWQCRDKSPQDAASRAFGQRWLACGKPSHGRVGTGVGSRSRTAAPVTPGAADWRSKHVRAAAGRMQSTSPATAHVLLGTSGRQPMSSGTRVAIVGSLIGAQRTWRADVLRVLHGLGCSCGAIRQRRNSTPGRRASLRSCPHELERGRLL